MKMPVAAEKSGDLCGQIGLTNWDRSQRTGICRHCGGIGEAAPRSEAEWELLRGAGGGLGLGGWASSSSWCLVSGS